MKGLTLSSLKNHIALVPLFVCVGVGCVGSVLYLGRLALRSPEVCWDKKGDQEPWNAWSNKRYQFLSPSKTDYSKIEAPPKF